MELSVNTFVSLDGVMQGPGGVEEDPSNGFERGGWLVPYAGDMGVVEDWFGRADAILVGRSTYEMMSGYWPKATDPDNAVGIALNTLPKYVVSTTLSDEDAGWHNTTVIRDDILERISALKKQKGREIQVHGSWQLARTLHDAGLVDVYRLMCFPVVVGDGKRLFDQGAAPSSFQVDEHQTTASGVMALTLRPTEFRTGGLEVVDGKEATV